MKFDKKVFKEDDLVIIKKYAYLPTFLSSGDMTWLSHYYCIGIVQRDIISGDLDCPNISKYTRGDRVMECVHDSIRDLIYDTGYINLNTQQFEEYSKNILPNLLASLHIEEDIPSHKYDERTIQYKDYTVAFTARCLGAGVYLIRPYS